MSAHAAAVSVPPLRGRSYDRRPGLVAQTAQAPEADRTRDQTAFALALSAAAAVGMFVATIVALLLIAALGNDAAGDPTEASPLVADAR